MHSRIHMASTAVPEPLLTACPTANTTQFTFALQHVVRKPWGGPQQEQ